MTGRVSRFFERFGEMERLPSSSRRFLELQND
jgi:hypothetical protein